MLRLNTIVEWYRYYFILSVDVVFSFEKYLL